MEKIGNLSEKFFQEAARDAVDDERWKELVRSNKVDIYEIKAYEWQKYGTKCPYCSEPWVKTRFENKFGDIEYFQPNCMCIPRCSDCGQYMMIAAEFQLPDCICRYDKINKVWRLAACLETIVMKSTSRFSESQEKKFQKCDGLFRLVDHTGLYKCDKCGRKIVRVKK